MCIASFSRRRRWGDRRERSLGSRPGDLLAGWMLSHVLLATAISGVPAVTLLAGTDIDQSSLSSLHGGCRFSSMDAAFGLLQTAPTAGARTLARNDRGGAGGAAEGEVAARDQRVRRQIVLLRI